MMKHWHAMHARTHWSPHENMLTRYVGDPSARSFRLREHRRRFNQFFTLLITSSNDSTNDLDVDPTPASFLRKRFDLVFVWE